MGLQSLDLEYFPGAAASSALIELLRAPAAATRSFHMYSIETFVLLKPQYMHTYDIYYLIS